MERCDLDAVVEAFLQGDYYVFPAEVADNYHSSDERFGTNALSNQVYRKGAPAWNMADAVHEYEERTGRLATITPAMRTPRRPAGGVRLIYRLRLVGSYLAADIHHRHWHRLFLAAPGEHV